jgi:hypothetical protein
MAAGHFRWRWGFAVAVTALAAGVPWGKSYAQSGPNQAKPWSLDDALPANSPAAQSRETKPARPVKSDLSKSDSAKPDLGRLPLRDRPGSFGIETETKVKSTEFPDGRPAPGVETTQRRPPSYFGLSISVPTTDK